MSFRRVSPLKSTVGLRPPSSGGGRVPSFRTKLFIEAHASINVPSTEKCSSDSNCCHSASSHTRSKHTRLMCAFSKRSRLALKVELVQHVFCNFPSGGRP